ncbi:MAG: YihY/virulence factor BrkB family protein [Acidobacteriota bacterium]|nr:YihY/virulence factor BrkB family protein [Acidobacteriota bacterium]
MTILSFKYNDLLDLKLKDFFYRLYDKAFYEEDLLSSAAQVAFYFTFALFPLLLFLISLFGIVLESADDLRTELFFYLSQAMPGSASDLVKKTIEEVTENSSGGKLTFGILIALYSASAGIDSIRVALNGVYNLTETRAWWRTKVLSIILTLVLAILITIALGVIFYGGKFLTLILDWINLPIPSPFFLGILQWVTVLVVLILTFALLYNYLPKHKKPSWVWITPGAIVGIVLWLGFSYAFRLYLGYFDTYDKTYGSVGAVIILMLWLLLTALVILIGGSMNAVLQEFTDPETAEAGAKKAAAKEVVVNPEKKTLESVLQGGKPDSLAALTRNKPTDDKNSGTENPAIEAVNKRSGNDEIPVNEKNDEVISKKSPLKLAAGLFVGLLENIFSSKRKP